MAGHHRDEVPIKRDRAPFDPSAGQEGELVLACGDHDVAVALRIRISHDAVGLARRSASSSNAQDLNTRVQLVCPLALNRPVPVWLVPYVCDMLSFGMAGIHSSALA